MFQIVKEAYVDHTQFEKKDVHFDPSSKPENPKWSMVGSSDCNKSKIHIICTPLYTSVTCIPDVLMYC